MKKSDKTPKKSSVVRTRVSEELHAQISEDMKALNFDNESEYIRMVLTQYRQTSQLFDAINDTTIHSQEIKDMIHEVLMRLRAVEFELQRIGKRVAPESYEDLRGK